MRMTYPRGTPSSFSSSANRTPCLSAGLSGIAGADAADRGGEASDSDTFVGVGTLAGEGKLTVDAALGVGGDAETASILSGEGVALYVCGRDDCDVGIASAKVERRPRGDEYETKTTDLTVPVSQGREVAEKRP